MDRKKQKKYLQSLKKNFLLRELHEDKIKSLLEYLDEEKWPKHTCSINRNKSLSRFHFIISGRLKIYKIDPVTSREFTLFLLKQNDVFDILCLLDNGEHDVFYEALDEVSILSTPIDKMREWIRTYPEINRNLLPYLGTQIRIVEEYAANITLIDISTRLAKLILNHTNPTSKKLELINDLTNEELANMIGSTRAVVNRHLQEFKNDGILKLGRKRMQLEDLQLLLAKIEGRGD